MRSLVRTLCVLLLLGTANPVFSEDQPPAKPREKTSVEVPVGQSGEPMVNYNEAASKAVREARLKQIEAIKRKNGELDTCVIQAVMSDAERRACGISVK